MPVALFHFRPSQLLAERLEGLFPGPVSECARRLQGNMQNYAFMRAKTDLLTLPSLRTKGSPREGLGPACFAFGPAEGMLQSALVEGRAALSPLCAEGLKPVLAGGFPCAAPAVRPAKARVGGAGQALELASQDTPGTFPATLSFESPFPPERVPFCHGNLFQVSYPGM